MDTLACQRVQEDRKCCDKGLTLSGRHLGDTSHLLLVGLDASVEDYSSDQLDVVMDHVPGYLVSAGHPVIVVDSLLSVDGHKVMVDAEILIHLGSLNLNGFVLLEPPGRGLHYCESLRKDLIQDLLYLFVLFLYKFVRFGRKGFLLGNRDFILKFCLCPLGGVRLRTPNPDLDFLANVWLERACVLGARWARVRSLGYRDVVSDCDCLAAFNPELAARDLKRMLAYQYSNGYAPRNVLGGSINDKNFADCCVGIPMAAHSIAMELGLESGFLDEEVPFNDGTKASVYEHCRRAMDFLWNFRGLHGLIRIWGGDWNDCMDTVGLQGRGASVWLSMAWCYANRLFGRLAEATGRADDAALARERGREMADIINAAAWDGGHYLCAYKDDGTKLGSDENEEGRVFLIQQLWSILAGVVTPERLPKVLHAIDVDLYDPMGTLVMAPGYSRIDNTIGYIGTKAPGIHENGGIYLHTLAWKLAAEAVLKRNDKLYETLQQMLPVRDDGTSRPSEPYMISNSIFGPQTGYRYGTPGQSWRTASAQWLLKSLVNFIFGLKPAPDGLHLEPCLPAQWPECGIVKRFRGTTYDITFRHEPGKACNRVASVLVDGAPHDPAAALPLRPGATLRVEVTLA